MIRFFAPAFVFVAGFAGIAAASAPAGLTLRCAGLFEQGGIALCRTGPGAEMSIDNTPYGSADPEGWAVIGFDRDAPKTSIVSAATPDGQIANLIIGLAPRTFDVQRIDGLPPQTVTPTAPAVLAKIRRDQALKGQSSQSRSPQPGFLAPFDWPTTGRISGAWGNQRVLNGVPRTPHYGVDIAVPTGTPVRAPGPAVVTLAERDMHFEGGLIVLDHGQGLFTFYLHLSKVGVAVGDRVAAGEVIGEVGATGRATGPHLCWRMRWRDRQIDPGRAVEGLRIARQTFGLEGDQRAGWTEAR